ncbi:MAG: bifunctional phosphoribosylaminoimidazolecarboxamide formyltransferase/IMP cyclohydrolase [Calditrichaeota bacterium]|nr:bifunctional phosphoribosylaminoimidazolecarboxamide formyltransferase/IMP cyclohydrolase [Calditrichota bacterium]MCB9391628.1 bifunctional phosphoribosylaminoimidazolecarboxamide formyltransferase/IMP cyclohydrolase [Calditrichota bacterium]
MIPIRRALLSVSDKTDLLVLAHALHEFGVELIASGGTARALAEAGLPVTPVETFTGHPEAMEGRIKTLHPRIHGGLLARRDHDGDVQDMLRFNLLPIDLLVVNFYPFGAALAQDKSPEEINEQIDVGGPSMVRAAVKNRNHVVVLTSHCQYSEFLAELRHNKGSVSPDVSDRFGRQAFMELVAYDSGIANWLNPDEFRGLALRKMRSLRYGENPHQEAALYSEFHLPMEGLVAADKLSGKQLSYNNLLDADGALSLLGEFTDCACVIIKHVTPCGVGIGSSPSEAIEIALLTDPLSAFGGIVALNRPLDELAATRLSDIFLEIILAPEFTSEARKVLAKKKSLRLITFDQDALLARKSVTEIRPVWGGYLMQDRDHGFPEWNDYQVVTNREPSPDEFAALKLGWVVAKHVRSNAIVFANKSGTLGVGAGQMSRVDSTRFAMLKAEAAGLSLNGSICASDAFFPFRDGLDLIARAGATAVVQPGGSVRDDEVISAANEHNIAMIFTGRRHFKH